jgi:hypothetical protein
MSDKKTGTIRQNEDKSWSYLHPTSGEWCSTFPDGGIIKTRDAARAERVALTPAKPAKSDSKTAETDFASSVAEKPDAMSDADKRSAVETAIQEEAKTGVDTANAPEVTSGSQETTSNGATSPTSTTGDVARQTGAKKIMQVTFTKSTKNRKSTSVVYTTAGLRGSARFAKTFFKDGNAPDTIVIDNDAFAEAKQKLTAEQRKEQRKNAPKLTPAEKLQKLQERAKKLEDRIAKQTAAAAATTAAGSPAAGTEQPAS